MSKKKLFLIDAYALIYRAYYAFIKNPRINSKGFDTSAIMGFLNSIFDIIKRENPDYFSVVLTKVDQVIELRYLKSIRQTETQHLNQF